MSIVGYKSDAERGESPWEFTQPLSPDDIYWAAVPCEKCWAADYYSRAMGGERPFLCPGCARGATATCVGGSL